MIDDKLRNFGSKKHRFNREDCRKGGRSKSQNKLDAISCNALKTGQHTPYRKYCNSCLLRDFCQDYSPGSECLHISPKALKIVMKLKGFNTVEEYDHYCFDVIQDVAIEEHNHNCTQRAFRRAIELLELRTEVNKRGGYKKLQR